MFISDSLLWLVHMFIFFTKEAENQYIDVSYIERKYGFSKSVTKYHL